MSTTTAATILVAEEEEMTRSFLYENLSADGYHVLVAADQAKALALLSTAQPDLVLVDVNGDTLSLIDALRSGEGLAGRADPDTPVIALGRDADRPQRIRLLDRGSDDVVKEPFAYPELRARIAAVLRRSKARRSARLRAGPLEIDIAGRDVRIRERPVKLSAKEYELLVTLASEPQRCSRARSCCVGVGLSLPRPHAHPGQPRLAVAAQALRRALGEARGQRVGRRLPAVRPAGGAMSDPAFESVDGLYGELASKRAGEALAAVAQEASVERLFSASARALEDAAGVLLHAAAVFIPRGGSLPGSLAEQAGALLAVAARFEEAADLSRSRDPGQDEKGGEP